jgi:hypothetical protein
VRVRCRGSACQKKLESERRASNEKLLEREAARTRDDDLAGFCELIFFIAFDRTLNAAEAGCLVRDLLQLSHKCGYAELFRA